MNIKKLLTSNPRKQGEAIQEIYALYFKSVLKLVTNNSGSREDAEDLFQDCIVVFVEYVRDPDFEVSCSYKTFFYSIARNLWLKKLRKHGLETPLKDVHDQIPVDEAQVDKLLDESEEEKIASCLDMLPEDCRELLIEYFFNNVSLKEIVNQQGFSNVSVAKNKKYRCMQKLRELAKVYFNDKK